MVKLSSLKKGEKVLLRNGDIKVYGIEKFNIHHVFAVNRNVRWHTVYDNRNILFELWNFVRW